MKRERAEVLDLSNWQYWCHRQARFQSEISTFFSIAVAIRRRNVLISRDYKGQLRLKVLQNAFVRPCRAWCTENI
jgi:hypothetical protein